MSQKTFKINSFRRQISLHEEQRRRYNQGNVGSGGTEKHTKERGKEETTAAICFDVQNMITLPRANVSNLFYERKLNCCN
jgi:hypothetical protein